MLQWVCAEAQGLEENDSSTILDLFGSDQFMSFPWAMSFLKVVPCPLLLLFQFQSIYLIGYMIARRNSNNLRDADDNTLMAESEEELKSFLMRGKERVKEPA